MHPEPDFSISPEAIPERFPVDLLEENQLLKQEIHRLREVIFELAQLLKNA